MHRHDIDTALHGNAGYRDVKLENILLDSDNHMKLIDFGLSAFFVPGKRLRVHCGSPSYAAPEIVSRKQYDGPPVVSWVVTRFCLYLNTVKEHLLRRQVHCCLRNATTKLAPEMT